MVTISTTGSIDYRLEGDAGEQQNDDKQFGGNVQKLVKLGRVLPWNL